MRFKNTLSNLNYMEDTNTCEPIAKQNEQLTTFKKILNDMMNDLMRTFPELETNLDKDLYILWKQDGDIDNSAANVFKYCSEVLPIRFLDILYQNNDMFTNADNNLKFLPGIDYRILMAENISESTRTTIWKYLQLILFSTVSNSSSQESFGDTAELFKAINNDEFKKKLEDTMDEMKKIFSNVDASNSCINPDDIPSAEKIHKNMEGLMEGKLGSLAKEIADETAADLNINLGDATNIGDVFSKLMKDPTKLMGMVKNVGTKLDNKIKSGDIKESELLEEASNLMRKMKDMPGMDNIQDLFSKMGLGSKGKINHGAMQSAIERNLKMAKQKERMQTRVGKIKPQTITYESLVDAEENAEKAKMALLKEIEGERVFRVGPKAQRSSLTDKKKGKKK